MLIATRDPEPDRGTNAPPVSHQDTRAHAPVKAPHSTRFVTALQMTGSVLAIPVALGSAYSVYQANFSPDVACQNLRAGIVTMIDKQMDAGTRRMLVRRDVEAFQKSCASFDPDATAAFVNLLASPRPAPKAATPKAEAKAEAAKETAKEGSKPAPKVEAAKAEKAETPKNAAAKAESAKEAAPKSETAKSEHAKDAAPKAETAKAEPVKESAPKAETAKSEPRPQAVAKQVAPAAEAEVNSDARWLDAVRHALVARAESGAAAVGAPARSLGSLVMPTPAAPAAALAPAAAPPPQAEAAAGAPAMAPALPPATAVPDPAPAATAARDPDRPVPPAEIPAGERKPSTWISSIPFVGQVLDR